MCFFFIAPGDEDEDESGDEHERGEEPEIICASEFTAAVIVLDEEVNRAGEQIPCGDR